MNDVTTYAQSLGYQGNRSVVVLDGRVISHGGVDWFIFCECLRKQVYPDWVDASPNG